MRIVLVALLLVVLFVVLLLGSVVLLRLFVSYCLPFAVFLFGCIMLLTGRKSYLSLALGEVCGIGSRVDDQYDTSTIQSQYK